MPACNTWPNESERFFMDRDELSNGFSYHRVAWGYLLSVTVAAVSFSVWFILRGFILRGPNGFESTAVTWQRIADLGLIMGLLFIVSWIAASICSAIPCLLLAWVVRKLKPRNVAFYLCSGVLIGLLAVPAWVWMFNSTSWYTDPPDKLPMRLMDGFAVIGLTLGLVGGVAGLMFWGVSGRHFHQSTIDSGDSAS